MRQIFLFMMVSLDGFFEGPNHDLSWHNVDREFNQFASEQMKEIGVLLFGRRTYDLMANYWPASKPSDQYDRIIAEKMNTLPKIVFSKTMTQVHEKQKWRNVTLAKSNLLEEIKNLTSQSGKPIGVLGSNNLSVQLLQIGLLDELRIMINPIIIGKGTRLFEGLQSPLSFQLTKTKTFASGNVLLSYHPKKQP